MARDAGLLLDEEEETARGLQVLIPLLNPLVSSSFAQHLILFLPLPLFPLFSLPRLIFLSSIDLGSRFLARLPVISGLLSSHKPLSLW